MLTTQKTQRGYLITLPANVTENSEGKMAAPICYNWIEFSFVAQPKTKNNKNNSTVSESLCKKYQQCYPHITSAGNGKQPCFQPFEHIHPKYQKWRDKECTRWLYFGDWDVPVDTIIRILNNSPSQLTQGSQRIVGRGNPQLGIGSYLHQADLCSGMPERALWVLD